MAPLNEAADWKRRVHARLLSDGDASRLSRLPRAALSEQVTLMTAQMLAGENSGLTGRQRDSLVQSVLYELVGLGPLEPLLEDEAVSEIMVNGPAQVYVERAGRLSLTDICFDDEGHLRRIIERILAPLGRRADDSSPLADGRLADGSDNPISILCHTASAKNSAWPGSSVGVFGVFGVSCAAQSRFRTYPPPPSLRAASRTNFED